MRRKAAKNKSNVFIIDYWICSREDQTLTSPTFDPDSEFIPALIEPLHKSTRWSDWPRWRPLLQRHSCLLRPSQTSVVVFPLWMSAGAPWGWRSTRRSERSERAPMASSSSAGTKTRGRSSPSRSLWSRRTTPSSRRSRWGRSGCSRSAIIFYSFCAFSQKSTHVDVFDWHEIKVAANQVYQTMEVHLGQESFIAIYLFPILFV